MEHLNPEKMVKAYQHLRRILVATKPFTDKYQPELCAAIDYIVNTVIQDELEFWNERKDNE